MIVVTGGAGFIGSHIIELLNSRGMTDLLVVDDLTDGHKIHNLSGRLIADYVDRDDFLKAVTLGGKLPRIEGMVHMGACSTTTEWDGRYLMKNNYDYSKQMLEFCQSRRIPFVYASSASVYGAGHNGFREELACERPINAYAYSKWQFDQFVRRHIDDAVAPVVGLRFFNVYGAGEGHKGSMASTIHHFTKQLQGTGVARVFGASHQYAAGEQRRDFVDVRDCAEVACHFLGSSGASGIFNVGTGTARSFNDVARLLIRSLDGGSIEYIPFPEHLINAYQAFTEADLSLLRAAGYRAPFRTLEMGIADFIGRTRPC